MTEDKRQPTSIPGLAHGQLCYLQIPAQDISASARFYEQAFGWRVAPPAPGFEAPMLIGQWVTDRPPAPQGGPALWIYVDEVERTLELTERLGATRHEGPTADGPRLLACIIDPAGNMVGIVQHGDHASAPRPSQRCSNRTMPACAVIPQLVYDDVPNAIDWLCEKFAFAERWRAGDHRAQLSFGEGTVAITEPRTSNVLPGRQSVMVRVQDAHAHHRRARERGANIISEPMDFPYGERQYTAEDLGGHHWTFSQSIADVPPEAWGGTSGPALESFTGGAGHAHVSDRPAISVMLIVPDADAAVAWYKQALGASELWDLGGVAGLSVQGAPFFLHQVNPRNPAEDTPARLGGTSTRVEVFVDDPDGLIERAVGAGARPGAPITDHALPWGNHRQGGFKDPFGHNWSVGDRSPLAAIAH